MTRFYSGFIPALMFRVSDCHSNCSLLPDTQPVFLGLTFTSILSAIVGLWFLSMFVLLVNDMRSE